MTQKQFEFLYDLDEQAERLGAPTVDEILGDNWNLRWVSIPSSLASSAIDQMLEEINYMKRKY